MDDDAEIKLYGWDSVNEEWVPILVDADGQVILETG